MCRSPFLKITTEIMIKGTLHVDCIIIIIIIIIIMKIMIIIIMTSDNIKV